MKEFYSDSYSFTVDKGASITSFLECSSERNEKYWDARYNRHFNDWELELVDSMLELLLYFDTSRAEVPDRMRS